MGSHFDPAERRDTHGRWTKGQTRAWLKQHPVDASNIVAMYDQATEGEKTAGAAWYPNAHKIAAAMGQRHGVSTRTAAGVIAAYSPQTPWGRNLMEANEVLRTHKAVGGKGAHLDIVRTPSDTEESRYGVMASGTNSRRAAALLGGADFENVFGGKRNKSGDLPPHSLKVRAFGELIANGHQTDPHRTRVVVDRHAASVARGVRLTEEDYAIDGPSSSKVKYQAYAEAYRQAAETLSAREGRTITPEALQATTWLTRQRLNNGVRARKALGTRDEDESLNYFASYEPNIADIVGHPMTGYAELSNEDADLAYNPAERRDSHGRWVKGAGPLLQDVLRGHNVKGLGTNPGGTQSPVNVHGDVMLAARLMAEGKHVRLNKVDQIGTLLTDLLKLSKEAKRKHETLDLCRVSVPKTNLFCAQNKGIDRINMPQLSGVPQPGSKAAALGEPGKEVDLTDQFEKTLRAHGVKVTDTTLPAASFKASQDQLIGDKVAGIEKFMETAPKDSGIFEPIFVTRDHYIIDGHHRWAAMVALDAKDGVLGNFPMKVRMVDMEIGEALAAAHAFANDWGIASEGVHSSSPTVASFGGKSLSNVYTLKDADLAFNPDQPRDSHGRWLGHGGSAVAEATKTPSVYQDFFYEQRNAQQAAETAWKDAPNVYASLFDEPDQCFDVPPCPQRAWAIYQMEGGYPTINNYLRNGVTKLASDMPITDETPQRLAADVVKAFDVMGYTTKIPGTVYRVNVGGHHMPFDTLKPGSTFTDKGVISTAANMADVDSFFEQEEFNGHATHSYLKTEDDGSPSYGGAYLMEIHLPVGTRVMGGAVGSIETMLKPGTKFKVAEIKKPNPTGFGASGLPVVVVEVQK